jgi:hypothetical protein
MRAAGQGADDEQRLLHGEKLFRTVEESKHAEQHSRSMGSGTSIAKQQEKSTEFCSCYIDPILSIFISQNGYR